MNNDRMNKVRWVQDNIMETARYFTDNYRKIDWVMDYCEEHGDSASKGSVAYLEDIWDVLTEAGYGERDEWEQVVTLDDEDTSSTYVDDGLHQGLSVEDWEEEVKGSQEFFDKYYADINPELGTVKFWKEDLDSKKSALESAKRRDEHLESKGGV